MGKKARRSRIIPPKTTYRVSLDEFLSQKQLWRKSIAKDGSCLFRAVAEQVSLNCNGGCNPVLHSHPSVKKRGLGGREVTSPKVVLWCVG